MCKDLLHGFDFSGFIGGSPLVMAKLVTGGVNFVLDAKAPKRKDLFLREAMLLKQSHSLCSSMTTEQERHEAAYMGFYLKNPGDFSHVVEELRKIPEVVECHFTTGQYDMFIKLFARNNQHLLEIIHTKLQPIGLSRTETLISFREIFRRQLPIEEVEDLD